MKQGAKGCLGSLRWCKSLAQAPHFLTASISSPDSQEREKGEICERGRGSVCRL